MESGGEDAKKPGKTGSCPGAEPPQRGQAQGGRFVESDIDRKNGFLYN